MVSALFDTNILIDYLNAVPPARDELERYTDKAISIITFMEVLAGAPAAVEVRTRRFLSGFAVLSLDGDVAERAVSVRKSRRVKLPDAIIQATVEVHGRLLVTRNVKAFPPDSPGVRVPYTI